VNLSGFNHTVLDEIFSASLDQ